MAESNGTLTEPQKLAVHQVVDNMLMRSNYVNNLTTQRAQLGRFLGNPRIDIDNECGYPKTGDISLEYYSDLYERMAIATRVVEVLPMESWQVQPTVFETEDVDEDTPFEQAWSELGKQLHGLDSDFQDEEGAVIWSEMLRLDILSGIGHYGVMLLGIDDGQELDQPVRANGSPDVGKLLYLRVADESLAPIAEYEKDPKSPRFGQPLSYDISFGDPMSESPNSSATFGLGSTTKRVHWSRVIHVADNLTISNVIGTPRMRPVYNHLMDLRKLYGGSAQMYWQGALPGLSFETHPELGGDVAIDSDALKEEVEKYLTGLQRVLVSRGMEVKTLSPTVSDPSPQIGGQIEAICIQLDVPKRIFMGSERGELSSGQDSRKWYRKLSARQRNHITPRMIVPFVGRLIMAAVLPKPAGYSVGWQDMETITDDEVATVAVKQTEAMAKYVQGNVESLMVPADYLERILGLDRSEVEAILEAAVQEMEEQEQEQAELEAKAKEMLDGQVAEAKQQAMDGIPVLQDEHAGGDVDGEQ